MDHELKQRLIGAVVVTALAAIFIPMLFDDPVDTSGKTVTELTIPQTPVDVEPAQNPPENKAQVLNRPDIELDAAEVNEENPGSVAGESPLNSGQPSAPDSLGSSGVDNIKNNAVEGSPSKQLDENAESGLDTGDVPGVDEQEDKQSTEAVGAVPGKNTEQDSGAPVKKPAPKSIDTEQAKVRVTPPPSKAVEKIKPADKAQKDGAQKSSSKLVRYSIQAGSFSKKENAQALVEKLRKQGMSASVVAKGDFFRVKIGPSLDKDKAKEMKAKLDKQNIKGLLIVE
jgi:DedD protein